MGLLIVLQLAAYALESSPGIRILRDSASEGDAAKAEKVSFLVTLSLLMNASLRCK